MFGRADGLLIGIPIATSKPDIVIGLFVAVVLNADSISKGKHVIVVNERSGMVIHPNRILLLVSDGEQESLAVYSNASSIFYGVTGIPTKHLTICRLHKPYRVIFVWASFEVSALTEVTLRSSVNQFHLTEVDKIRNNIILLTLFQDFRGNWFWSSFQILIIVNCRQVRFKRLLNQKFRIVERV